MLTIKTATIMTFTAEGYQIEVEKGAEAQTFTIRENVGADPNNPLWKSRFSGTITDTELQELQNGLSQLLKNSNPAGPY
jgi:hypothetical protein